MTEEDRVTAIRVAKSFYEAREFRFFARVPDLYKNSLTLFWPIAVISFTTIAAVRRPQ